MKLDETIEEIEDGREKIESAFVFGLINNPDLIDDYDGVDKEGENILHNEDAIFYYNLAKGMWNAGFRSFDALAFESYLSDKDRIRKKFDGYGGYSTIVHLKDLAASENTDANYDKILAKNMLIKIAKEYEHVFKNVTQLASYSSEEVYNVFDLIASKVSLEEGRREEIKSLTVTKEYFEACKRGDNVGLSFEQPKVSKLLNGALMGLYSPGFHLLASQSGVGKTSFTVEVILLGLIKNGYNVGIISNELDEDRYQNLLTAHILREDLGIYNITRGKVLKGVYTDEEEDILMNKVTKIADEKYMPHLHFVKMYDNNANQIIKQMKRMRNQLGVDAILLDTYKSDDETNGNKIWEDLILSSRKIFRAADKLNLAVIGTYQLAAHTVNQRYLDVSALSQSKAIKEVLESLILCRKIFEDEMPDEKNALKCYRRVKNGDKWDKEKIELNPDKSYYIIFINKTRSSESGNCLLYEANLATNSWKEVGWCSPKHDYMKTY